MTRSNPERLAAIQRNIDTHGYHAYCIAAKECPRYVYTIGNLDRIGREVVLAGGAFYRSVGEASTIVKEISARLASSPNEVVFELSGLGDFSLRPVHTSWVETLLLGATDYYQGRKVEADQVVPLGPHMTIDVPRMDIEMTATSAPVWRWEIEQWSLSIPRNSVAVTNLAALRGGRITEVVRWESDQWDMFCGPGPGTPKEEFRFVPLWVLIGSDPSLEVALSLATTMGLLRDDEHGEWRAWNSAQA